MTMPMRGATARLGVEHNSTGYALLEIRAGEHPFLREVFDAFSCDVLRVWVDKRDQETGFDRLSCEGLVTAMAECDGRAIALAWSDFRVRGASYGRANSRRFAAFLHHLREQSETIPLVYVVNSAGFSLMEGRTAFSDVFALWPELLDYSRERLVLTCAAGKCLGLAPILYGLGHYRVAVAGHTQINLTGPEVIRMFFGQALDFGMRAAAERCLERHELVHETVPSIAAALTLFRGLLAPAVPAVALAWPQLDGRTGSLLASLFDGVPREIVPGWCPRVRLFLGARNGRAFGLFINPFGRSNNMITVRTLQKYSAGLDLFRSLRLPVVSVLDSPGIDPRFDESDAGLIRQILSVGEQIIHYPHGRLGVIAGRCFGGATTLSFPKVFGGSRCIALRGAQFGVMHERIVDQVLKGSPRLLAQWRKVAASQRPDCADLLEEGSLDAVIAPAELPGEVDRFLDHAAARLPASRRSVRASGGLLAVRRLTLDPARHQERLP
jgi:acetyl-CoA carboxylase carboxyltransferase component